MSRVQSLLLGLSCVGLLACAAETTEGSALTASPDATTDGGASATGTDSGPSTASSDASGGGLDAPGLDVTAPEVGVSVKPLALVYVDNPISTPTPTEVELLHLTTWGTTAPAGLEPKSLVGDYADVVNCWPDAENGTAVQAGPLTLTQCTPKHAALPGQDGTYRHIVPPTSPTAADDRFAEVMMYHHMQVIHDYFKDGHGLTDLDRPLKAVVNLQVHPKGLCDEWSSIGNAAYSPDGIMDFGFPIDLKLGGDAIIFGQTTSKDFAYEAGVIYHEYTHAMVGTTRLSGLAPDNFGLTNLSGALNEAYADYFSCTVRNNPIVGEYALNATEAPTVCGVPLGGAGGNLSRDLTAKRACPGDLTGEVHADSEIFSAALWEIREKLGAEKADDVIFGALHGFSNTTDFNFAAQLTAQEAVKRLKSNDEVAIVNKAFNSRGIIGCKRVVPAKAVGSRGLPLTYYPHGAFGGDPWGGFVPGLLQIQVDAPPDTKEIQLDFKSYGTMNASVAWKAGPEPVVYYVEGLFGKQFKNDAMTVSSLEKTGKNAYRTRLSGSCVSAGTWTFSIHNQGGDFQLVGVTATFAKAPTGTPNFDTCGK